MLMQIESIYDRLPPEVQNKVRLSYYYAFPNKDPDSIIQQEKNSKLIDEYIDRFFSSREEYSRYKEEFLKSEIPKICIPTDQNLSDEYTIYDIHKKEAIRYYALVRKLEPDVIFESGVYNGVSTLCLLTALHKNETGTLYSVDYSDLLEQEGIDWEPAEYFQRPKPSSCEENSEQLVANKEPGWIIPDYLRENWTSVQAKSGRDILNTITSLDKVDIYLHDSSHSKSNMLFEFELAWRYLSEQGILLSHHIGWNDAFRKFQSEKGAEGGLLMWRKPKLNPCECGYLIKP
jgi:hypothetical protein